MSPQLRPDKCTASAFRLCPSAISALLHHMMEGTALSMSYASPTKTFSGIQQSVSNLESESPMSMHLASQLGMEIERQRASLPIKWPDAGPLESQVPDSALHPLHLGWCCVHMSSQRYSSTGHRFLFDLVLPCIEHSSRPSL